MRNAETAVISRVAIISFIWIEIQSRHASSTAWISESHISRDARTVSIKIEGEQHRSMIGKPNFFINVTARLLLQNKAGGRA